MGDLQYSIYPEVICHFLSGTHGYQLKKNEKTLDPTAHVSLGHPSAIPCPHRFFLTYMRTMGKEHSALARWGPHWQDVRTATAANCASKREAMVMTRKMTEGPGASGRQVEITNEREREREASTSQELDLQMACAVSSGPLSVACAGVSLWQPSVAFRPRTSLPPIRGSWAISENSLIFFSNL